MAVAAPARKTAPAPAPSRTTPPRRKKAAPARPAPQKRAAPARAPGKPAAPKRQPRSRPKPKGSVAARTAPARKAPARRAPARTKPRTRRNVSAQIIPFAGRTAVAVGQLPDSGLVVRLTRGRAWIAVLGALLAGIVALNVATLSFAATLGQVDAQVTTLDQENSILNSRHARVSGTAATRNAAGAQGLAMPPSDEIHFTDAGPDDVATAAQRLAAAAGAG